MSGDLTPQRPELRLSNADREEVVAMLQTATAEGRLTLDEFQERVDGVLAARTFGELQPYLRDLPAGPAVGAMAAASGGQPPVEYGELRGVATSLRRTGRWNVPRRLSVSSKAGSVKLDFTDAVLSHPVIEIELSVTAGSTTLVLPAGSSADADAVQMTAGSLVLRQIPPHEDGRPRTHFVVTGSQRAGSLVIRRQYRFWRWRW